jgi:hypothetical protein
MDPGWLGGFDRENDDESGYPMNPMDPLQQFNFDFNDPSAWNQNSYQGPDFPSGFGDFHNQDHPEDGGQHEGQYEGGYEYEVPQDGQAREHVEEAQEDFDAQEQFDYRDYLVDQEGSQEDFDPQEQFDYQDYLVAQEDSQENVDAQEDDKNDGSDNESADDDLKLLDRAEFYKAEFDRMTAEGVYKCLIQSEADCKESRIDNAFQEVKNSGTLVCELDDVSMKYWVGRLFLAFKNIDNINDKTTKYGKLAQAAQRLSNNYYPDETIEIACWKVVVSLTHWNILTLKGLLLICDL